MNPQIREAVDIQLIQDNADKIIYLSCKLGISQPLALVAAVGPILMMLDGTHSLEAIKAHFSQQGVDEQIIDRVLQVLNDNYYLNTQHYLDKKQTTVSEFRAGNVRAAAHAGRIYSNDVTELNLYLEKVLGDQSLKLTQFGDRKLVGLVSPHIDYRRGSIGYAHAYKQLASQKPDICVLMGTSHQAGRSLFQLSKKDFACPNGTLSVEKDFMSALLKGYGEERALADELLHRQEHSLELQLPFINYYCPDTKIIPILVGNFYPYLRETQGPSSDLEYREFVDCLAETITKFTNQGAHITIVAGVDMAHIGQNFGDEFLLNEAKILETEAQDKIYLDTILSLSSAQMFEHVAKDRDQRRICGFPTMHTVLDVLAKQNKDLKAEILNYKQAVDFETECLVSFAAMGIYETSS